ncbi:DUF1194 domain-containing protein [Aestuariivirga litoralis]|uniref:DUF1194 domain-containing protein n=1 Tax=Aestuariivirga litoralis TaxID=2650924 RepID=UPI0018C62670|nr:DUF1194 domain-containing protein [Aestuariivirga litoralis]MBG1231487.1 DUF1194 domain-containing protein [Aestuariivirga litoralis]
MASVSIVDVALVLAVDVSSSMDAGDFALQTRGISKALREPDILEAIKAGPAGAVALSLVQWSTPLKQVTSLRWRVLDSEAALKATADEVENLPRDWQPGGTGMAAALKYCTHVFDDLHLKTGRKVIDISGDGGDSEHGNMAQARGGAVARGIVINGLPILTGSPEILAYYSRTVIGGEGCFVEPAINDQAFSEAMHRKLLRELQAATT